MVDIMNKAAGCGVLAQFRTFLAREDGAVTVDWVVLTGALVGLSIGVFSSVQAGLVDLSGKISDGIASAEVMDLGTVNDW